MPVSKVISAMDAVAIIHDGDVVATSGYGGHGVPEELLIALEQRFLSKGDPCDLTLVHAGGQGDIGERGLNHLGHEGMIKRVIGGHYGLVPKIARLALDEKIEAYNFPEGVIVHLYRNIAAGAPGLLSTIGLGTFVDPRVEGGKVNTSAEEDLVSVVEFGGEEWLLYRAFPIDIAIVRGTTADPQGNVTMEHEALSLETLSLAIAAKTSGGYVLCQVERIAQTGSLDSREVRIPGVLVDAIVVAEPENHMQTFATVYDPAMSGEIRVPLETLDRLPLDHRKVIARRAAFELAADSVVNLGVGLPDAIGTVAAEENIQDLITLTVDPGVIGGVPLGGLDFGGATNREAVIDHASAFDFIDGGGLDAVFLGVGQIDARGDVNVSRFDGRLAGCGGFINLTQRTPKVVFVTTFTSGGLRTTIEDGHLYIVDEGRIRKFVDEVEQITFRADRSRLVGQEVMYLTERAVFRLGPGGIVLTEVAPGIDIEQDILSLLPFEPTVDDPVPMDPAVFLPGSMGLRDRILDVRIEDRLTYDQKTNTVFMNYSGMHVRTPADVDHIVEAVDALLGPLEGGVNSIVNYDRFVIDEEAVEAYADAVRYVDETYYLSVSRHSTSGFLRLKLGKELTKRRMAPALYETAEEAIRHLDNEHQR